MSRLLDAHLRLLCLLPVRTVAARPRRPAQVAEKVMGRPGRPLEIDGVRYESVRDAYRKRNCSTKTIYKLLDMGQARYV